MGLSTTTTATAMLRLVSSRRSLCLTSYSLAAAVAVAGSSSPLRSGHRHRMASVRCFGGGGGPARKAVLRGVVFDMDGTLTVPVIDFGAMYREVLGEQTYAALRAGSPHGSIDILHHIETWAPPAQRKAYEVIARFEQQGLERLQIMPGECVASSASSSSVLPPRGAFRLVPSKGERLCAKCLRKYKYMHM